MLHQHLNNQTFFKTQLKHSEALPIECRNLNKEVSRIESLYTKHLSIGKTDKLYPQFNRAKQINYRNPILWERERIFRSQYILVFRGQPDELSHDFKKLSISNENANQNSDLALVSRPYHTHHMYRPFPALNVSIPDSIVHRVLQHFSLRILDSRVWKIEYHQELAPQPDRRFISDLPASPVRTPTPCLEQQSLLASDSEIIPNYISKKSPFKKMLGAFTLKRNHWAFFPFNLLVFAMISYLAFYSFENIRHARAVTGNTDSHVPVLIGSSLKSSLPDRPLSDYQTIWQSNLFHSSELSIDAERETVAIDNIAMAENDLGLVLVGTIASGDADLRRAIIYNLRLKRQEAYREGEIIGQVQIKKILQGKVVILTDSGDRLLAVTYEKGRLKSIDNENDMDSEEDSFEELYTEKRRSYRRRRADRVRHVERDEE
jgi:hypothetical protein